MAAGILFDRGLLDPSHTLGRYLSSYMVEGTDPKWGDLTVHQLMRHRTGAREGVDFDLTNAHLWEDPEWLHTLFAIPIVAPPEESFVYSDGNYYILGRIVEELAGMDLGRFMEKEVFAPLGFHVNAWSRDGNGHTVGGTGLYLRTEDMAKIGWLWLNKGKWGDRRIFSEEWADRFLNYEIDGVANYGYGICRLTDDIVAAGGMYGQGVCADLRTRRAVAFHCFDPEGKTHGLNGAFLRFCR
jgi:CubicO group peptidase (beta-lactamase class C family)